MHSGTGFANMLSVLSTYTDMNSSRLKKILLVVGILIALIIGINTYAGAMATPDPILDQTISWIEKLKDITDFKHFVNILQLL